MNIFGAFTFGSLIKTFLPGFVWLIALGIVVVDIAQWYGRDAKMIWELLKSKDQAVLVLAIPASILLGLLSNIAVFTGLNNRWVRNPVRKAEPDRFRLYDRLSQQLRDQCWTALAWNDETLRPGFDNDIDPEIIIVERLGVEKLAYVREQYWYHLEFQLNLLISLLAIFAALFLSALINSSSWPRAFVVAALWVVAGFVARKQLLKAAKKNYSSHIAKMASLMAALLSPPPSPPPAQGP
jgi:hypothetical protein